ncbi:MAG: tetratricopeptide repeat protein [Pyrinomonadaceae bacterium]|nr:tetratricopeptide repeat protein [Pyrinomonadaceae bacterium]
MKRIRLRLFHASLVLGVLLALGASTAFAQQQGRSRFDVTNYRIEAQLIPAEHLLRAAAEVTFTPLEPTRSVVFELNGSLKVESINRNGKPLTNFVQDAVGVGDLGPSVRIDLGEVVPANQPVTLTFRWSGALVSPEGGPLATKRLAYVGTDGSYLMYAARWFPFHDYAADRATADITIIVPNGTQVAGSSDEALAPATGKDGNTRYRFVHKTPALIGNIAAGQYITRTLKFGSYELQFFLKPGSENRLDRYGELMGSALQAYTQAYGSPTFGTRISIAQIDDESLDTYSGLGMVFLASKMFDPSRPVPEDRLQREVAYQWWGITVGLKSFDDAWLSQGLAEWSAYALREATLSGGALDAAQREEQERALTFEQTASIARAPSTLDDQSAAYQSIVYYKGAMVFRMLRETIGREKFNQLLRNFLQQYRGKDASIDDFEKLTTQVVGENMRYFFAQWVEGTGVPEFNVEYQIIRTRAGRFRARGTVRQNFDNLRLPVELMLRSEGDSQTTTVRIENKSEDFDFESNGQPLEVIVDPNNKILRMSDDLKVAIVARRGIEQFKEGSYAEAQQQFEAALKLDRSNSWVYYNLGLLYLEQRNWNLAIDNFRAALNGNMRPAWIAVWAHIKAGNAFDARGDRARAVTEYKQALQLGDNYDNAQKVAQRYIATPFDPKAEQTQAGLTNSQ